MGVCSRYTPPRWICYVTILVGFFRLDVYSRNNYTSDGTNQIILVSSRGAGRSGIEIFGRKSEHVGVSFALHHPTRDSGIYWARVRSKVVSAEDPPEPILPKSGQSSH